MTEVLQTYDLNNWQQTISLEQQSEAIHALEQGKILYFPQLPFTLITDEKEFLDPKWTEKGAKNISFNQAKNQLKGTTAIAHEREKLQNLMRRYVESTQLLIKNVLPFYQDNLELARTSYRPVEIKGRPSSYRKDDTLLHVDAFSATPNQGKRILRIFSNVNPQGEPRVWRVGEPFEKVVAKFKNKLPKYHATYAKLLQMVHATRGYRSEYDHYMLHLHNTMKADSHYQQTVPQCELHLPSGATWIVYTDIVSHAAMKGQYLFEQTFYLPIDAMQQSMLSPKMILEQKLL